MAQKMILDVQPVGMLKIKNVALQMLEYCFDKSGRLTIGIVGTLHE